MIKMPDASAAKEMTELEACRKNHDNYVEWCRLLEQAEANGEPEARLKIARDITTTYLNSWRASIRVTVYEPSLTHSALLEKTRLLAEMLRELCSGDDETASITLKFLEDVEGHLRQECNE